MVEGLGQVGKIVTAGAREAGEHAGDLTAQMRRAAAQPVVDVTHFLGNQAVEVVSTAPGPDRLGLIERFTKGALSDELEGTVRNLQQVQGPPERAAGLVRQIPEAHARFLQSLDPDAYTRLIGGELTPGEVVQFQEALGRRLNGMNPDEVAGLVNNISHDGMMDAIRSAAPGDHLVLTSGGEVRRITSAARPALDVPAFLDLPPLTSRAPGLSLPNGQNVHFVAPEDLEQLKGQVVLPDKLAVNSVPRTGHHMVVTDGDRNILWRNHPRVIDAVQAA